MKRHILRSLPYAILLFLLIQGISCGTAKSLYKKVRPKSNGLKKKVLVLPVIDQAGVGKAKAAEITNTFAHLLNEDAHLKVFKSNKPLPSKQKTRSPEFGIVIDPQMAKRAQELGMNVLITVVLNPFEITSKKSGIWPFRKLREEAEISLLVNAMDIVTGTLFMSNMETEKVKIPEEFSEEQVKKEEIDDYILGEALSDLLEDLASAVTSELRDEPWWGWLVSMDGKNIVINAGGDVGLTRGTVFEVFALGESIRSAKGESFYLLGPKVGEIETVKIMHSNALAVPLNGGEFKPGQLIKTKD